ncbi:MAG: arginyl-tRNA synthetase [Cyanobacteria bacterium P01_G01_bin.49]
MKIQRNICDSFNLKFEITDFSWQRQLKQFLGTQLINFSDLKVPNGQLSPETLSLSRLSDRNSVIYRSAIAFQLVRQSAFSPFTLAAEIFQLIKQQQPKDDHLPQSSITLRLVDPGWLEFEVSDRSLEIWLQTLLSCPWPLKQSSTISANYNHLFPIEYSHARCCTLLRLAAQEKLIQLNNGTFEKNLSLFKCPNPIPWYNPELNQLRVSNSAERSLISQMIITTDRLINESTVDEIKLANHLSQSFLDFERYCRIFGIIAQKQRKLSQARLGLVAITQYLLQGLWLSQFPQPPRSQL